MTKILQATENAVASGADDTYGAVTVEHTKALQVLVTYSIAPAPELQSIFSDGTAEQRSNELEIVAERVATGFELAGFFRHSYKLVLPLSKQLNSYNTSVKSNG